MKRLISRLKKMFPPRSRCDNCGGPLIKGGWGPRSAWILEDGRKVCASCGSAHMRQFYEDRHKAIVSEDVHKYLSLGMNIRCFEKNILLSDVSAELQNWLDVLNSRPITEKTLEDRRRVVLLIDRVNIIRTFNA